MGVVYVLPWLRVCGDYIAIGKEPIIYHGFTFTSKLPLRDVIRTINVSIIRIRLVKPMYIHFFKTYMYIIIIIIYTVSTCIIINNYI